MEISQKELDFAKEYEELIRKYNVKLVISPWSDEYGSHVNVSFTERGRYVMINYRPDAEVKKSRYCGMGQ